MGRKILGLVLATVVLSTVPSVRAQVVGKTPRAGLLALGAERNPQVEGFQQALRDLGYVEDSCNKKKSLNVHRVRGTTQ